jgi:hypothetical protein
MGLGALSAKLTGKDAVAGAMGGLVESALGNILDANGVSVDRSSSDERFFYSTGSMLTAGIVADLLGKDPVTAAEVARNAAENNYLLEESGPFDEELSECKKLGKDCTAIYEKYLAISNKNSRELRERCDDGGVTCVQYGELIQAYYSYAPINLANPDAAAMVQTLNGLDLLFLNDKISTGDQLLFGFLDYFPLSVMGIALAGRNMAANTGRTFASATLFAGTDAALQYSLTGEVRLADLISSGVLGAAFAIPIPKTSLPGNVAGGQAAKGGTAAESMAATNTTGKFSEISGGSKLYPDGSLRTPDGKFASVAGNPAPGTSAASNYADFLSQNGVNVVGKEMVVEGPLGLRRYDIVVRDASGNLQGIEIKTGTATKTPYQDFTDRFVNQFGAQGMGRISGETVKSTITIYLP